MKKLFVGVLWVALSLSVQGKEVNMTSPDGKYQFTLSDSGGQLHYSLTWNGKQTVKPSLLGINANVEWRDGVEIGTVDSSRKDTIWHPVYGERSEIKDCYNAWKILVNRQNGRDKLILDIRAYDEGIAFRYHFPGGQYLKITDEYTEYTMPEGTKAYFTPKAQTPYSYLPLENWPGESDRPLLLTLAGGGYVCLAEAQVVDYVRTKFNVSSTKKNTIISAMYGPVEDIAPYSTPWRVIMCADKPGEILEHNDILLNLNPPCRIKDTSWIKPGKVMREVTLTTQPADATKLGGDVGTAIAASGLVNARVYYELNPETGKVEFVGKDKMLQLLKNEPELLNAFLQESSESAEVTGKYLLRLK